MPRTTLSNLPVEIHFEIFKYAQADYREYYYRPCLDESDDDNDDNIFGWKRIEIDKLSRFPYNAAAVCKLWLAVLTKIPECWTRVTFDIATDPSRLLDIFLWSKNLPKLEVTVFNTHKPESEDVDYSSLERERVSAIVNALRPHVSRCKSITFDVVFLTSLPSPVIFLLNSAPHLEELTLECKINNAGSPDDYSRTCDLGVRGPIQTPSLFPEFKNLSLTGFWFMFVAGHPYTSEWFEQISTKDSCSVSQIQFQKEGLFTVQNFVSFFSTMKSKNITLSDLSLNHVGPIFEGDGYDDEVFSFRTRQSVDLKNVSADVIQTLFFLADISPGWDLTFDNCVFPYEALPSGSSGLWLKNIPSFIPADSTSSETSTNLASILQDWNGHDLHVISCPSFDDEVLSILPGREDSDLLHLYLDDCDNFTVRGLRRYLKRKHKPWRPSDTGYRLETLHVRGTHCAFPNEEEKEWFRDSEFSEKICVNWQVQNPENSKDVQKFFTNDYPIY